MAGVMTFPTRIVHGRGSAAQLAPELKRAGAQSRVFLVTEAEILKANLLRFVVPALEQAGLKVTVWPEVDPGATEANVQAAVSALAGSGADAVVALGGGPVLDVAKAARLLAASDGGLASYAAGQQGSPSRALLPLAVLPTTAGSGGEASGEAVLSLGGEPTLLSHPRLLPDVALLDAELTAALPALPTAMAGFNALAHAAEAVAAKGDHPIADALALEALRRLAKSLKTAVKNGRDLDARENVLLGACLAGIAAQKGQGPARALAWGLASVAGTPHGLSLSALLGPVLQFDKAEAEGRVAQVAVALGFNPSAPASEAAAACAGLIEELKVSCALPRKLSQVGVRRDQLPAVIEKASASPVAAQGPRACSEVDCERLLGEAF
jgi:alcohol dehydrogenase class IV